MLEGRFVIEMTPIRPSDGAERGVVAEGAVGAHAAGRFRLFRYEVRCWRDGIIPDMFEAVGSPTASSRIPTALGGCSSCAAGSDLPSGVGTSWARARCGTQTRLPRG